MALWSNKDLQASKPKYIDESKLRSGEVLVFVDNNEAQVDETKAKGICNPGWWLHYTYTDAQGSTRYKAECLVALHSTAAFAGDASDDTLLPDNKIRIGTKPKALTVATGEAAQFTVVATNVAALAMTYLWKADGVALEDGVGGVSGATTATLDIADATGLDGVAYSVTVTSVGAVDVTTSAAVLTVTA